MLSQRAVRTALACLLVADAAAANDGPDLTVLELAKDAGLYFYYGSANGVAAYSMAATACNAGTLPVEWTSADHPVFAQNVFRLRDGLFEQIGQSWLHHGTCATSEAGCGACQPTSCSSLGVGCASTDLATDGQLGGPKSHVDPLTGAQVVPYPAPTGPAAIRGRLQVRIEDIDPTLPENAGAKWFAEGQLVSAHDATHGNAADNQSWQPLAVPSYTNLGSGGATRVGEPALFAWLAEDPQVLLRAVTNVDEGGPGLDGRFWIGSRATDLGGGRWRYVYVVQNLTSRQAGASLGVRIPGGVLVQALHFHDVAYHSGEPYDGTDWGATLADGMLAFACPEAFGANPDANALRWGTAYTFAFEADAPPETAGGNVLGLFEPGVGTALEFEARVPMGQQSVGVAYCSGDGTGAPCPCSNHGQPDHGCANGTYAAGARLAATGSASVSSADLSLDVLMAVEGQPGLFFQGDNAVAGGDGVAFGDGLRCAGGGLVRLELAVPGFGGAIGSTVDVAAEGGVSAGETRRYQFWYRDPTGSPCGNGFNLSNGLELTWTP